MKKSTDAFFAFDSPNMPPIAKIGINIEGELLKTLRLEERIETEPTKKLLL
jgi:L-asparaginase/Glu-tRNA(Gln) amidotransferase subunit D